MVMVSIYFIFMHLKDCDWFCLNRYTGLHTIISMAMCIVYWPLLLFIFIYLLSLLALRFTTTTKCGNIWIWSNSNWLHALRLKEAEKNQGSYNLIRASTAHRCAPAAEQWAYHQANAKVQ